MRIDVGFFKFVGFMAVMTAALMLGNGYLSMYLFAEWSGIVSRDPAMTVTIVTTCMLTFLCTLLGVRIVDTGWFENHAG